MIAELRLDELRPGVAPLADALRTGLWMRSLTPPDERRILGLGEGESAAIQLAQHLRSPVLMDERRGRHAARSRGVAVIGTGRVLIAARERNLIESVAEVLEALRASGYRLSDELCARLLRIAKESPADAELS